MTDRNFRAAVAEIDIHRGSRRVFDAAIHMIKRVDERRDLAMHADHRELRALEECDITHYIFARHRKGDVFDLRLPVTICFADLMRAHDKCCRIAAEGDGDLRAHYFVGAWRVSRGNTNVLHEHVLREWRKHHAIAAKSPFAQHAWKFAREIGEAIFNRLRANLVAEGNERRRNCAGLVAH